MTQPWDGTCRGNNTGRIIELLEEGRRPMTLRELGERMGRGVAYMRGLVDVCDEVHYRVALLPVSSWQVELNDTTKSEEGE